MLRLWFRELVCRLAGHDPVWDRTEYYCGRCGDVLPEHGR